MFKLICCNVQKIQCKDGRVFYRIWFKLQDESLAWLISNKPYQSGDEVPITVFSYGSKDVNTNMRLSLKIG